MKGLIAPSILSADFADLGREAARAAKAGADWLHVDVMDGHFVPNLTLGPVVVRSLRPRTALPLDVHLMISHPTRFADAFARAGADWISFHWECQETPDRVLRCLRATGKKVGICLKPATPVSRVARYLSRVDLVVVMTVEPGFAGQKFMPEQMEKLAELADLRRRRRYRYLLEVDGGVDRETAPLAWKAGADVLVAGTAVYGHKNTRKAVGDLRPARG